MRKLTLPFIILAAIGIIAAINNPYTSPPIADEIIKFNDVPYDGKRLYIGPVSTNSTRTQINFAISNTGRRDIQLGQSYKNIAINLDPSFNQIGSTSEVRRIVEQILENDKMIKAGEVMFDKSMTLRPTVAQNKKPTTTNRPISKSKTESSTSTTVSPKPTATTTPTTSTTKKPTTKKESKRPARPEPETIDMGNGTVVLETPEKEGDEKRGKFLDPNNCPDLIIKNIEILKVNKFMIALEYTVKNQGTGEALLYGPKNTVDDNMFLKAYLSATPKFTRSAQEIGEAAVRKEVGNKEGSLDNSREFKGKMYINVRGRTNKTPYLLLTLDPYQTVRECNERNNRSFIKIVE